MHEFVIKVDEVLPDEASDELADWGSDIGGQIAKAISHGWEDDSFSYEYGSERGVHHQWHAELTSGVTLLYPNFCDAVLTVIDGTYRGGGCDGEHRGRCTRACAEVEIDFRATLHKVEWTKEGFRATYTIEPRY